MNALANILLFIFGASVLYGVIFSRPQVSCPPAEGSPETAPSRSTAARRARPGPIRERGCGPQSPCPAPPSRSRWHLIADGIDAGFASFGAVRKW